METRGLSRKSQQGVSKEYTQRAKYILKEYGITLETYNALLESQHYVCKICGLPSSNRKHSNLCVDHDHKTGRIRGLLCSNCNTGLGFFKDNPTSLLKAIQYLKGSL